jgi:hypothetical protein
MTEQRLRDALHAYIDSEAGDFDPSLTEITVVDTKHPRKRGLLVPLAVAATIAALIVGISVAAWPGDTPRDSQAGVQAGPVAGPGDEVIVSSLPEDFDPVSYRRINSPEDLNYQSTITFAPEADSETSVIVTRLESPDNAGPGDARALDVDHSPGVWSFRFTDGDTLVVVSGIGEGVSESATRDIAEAIELNPNGGCLVDAAPVSHPACAAGRTTWPETLEDTTLTTLPPGVLP